MLYIFFFGWIIYFQNVSIASIINFKNQLIYFHKNIIVMKYYFELFFIILCLTKCQESEKQKEVLIQNTDEKNIISID